MDFDMYHPFVSGILSSAKKRRRPRATLRRRALAASLNHSSRIERLEDRRLLASDVTIGLVDSPASYIRTLAGTEVNYSPVADSAQIGDFMIGSDLSAGLNVVVNTDNPAGTQDGDISVTGDIALSVPVSVSLELRAEDDIVLNNAVLVSGASALAITLNSDRDASGSGRVEIDNTSVIDAGGGDITLIADELALPALSTGFVQSTGELTIQPATPSSNIALGDAVPSGGLLVDNSELASIRDGFSSITFGNVSTGTGAVTVDNVVLTDPVTVVGGSIAIQNGLSSEGGLTLTARDAAGAGQDVRIDSGTVADTAGNVVINAGDDVTVAAGSIISALGAGARVAINVDPGPDADPGIGSNVAIDGTLTSSAAAVTAAADIDTLAVNGGGGTVFVSSTGVIIPATSTTIDITNLENVTVTNATDIDVTGNVDTTFILSAVPSSTSAAIAISGGPVVTFDSSVTTAAVINGTDGDDTFVVDVSAGLPGGIFDFRGGLNQNTGPGDQILLQGSSPTTIGDLSLDYTNLNDGFIDIDGVTAITFTGLEPITSSIDAANVLLNYSSAAESIDVTQNGTDVTVNSTAGEVTTFAAPSTSLNIDTGGGADTVTVNSLNLDLASGLGIMDPESAPNDFVVFQGAASTIMTGSLDVQVPLIDITADLMVDGTVDLGITGSGGIGTDATITSATGISFFAPVTLIDDTIVNASGAGSVEFRFEVDGPRNLAINDTTAGGTFLSGALGGSVALTSLTTGAGAAGTFVTSSVVTTGDQTYRSAVVTSGGGGLVDFTSDNDIEFSSTLDNGSAPADQIIIDAPLGSVMLRGAVGSINPPGTFDVISGTAVSIGNDMTVTGDIGITVGDSSAAGENLQVLSPAIVTSLTGDLVASVGDDVDIQAGATVSLPSGMLDVTADQVTPDPDTTGSIVSVNGAVTALLGAFLRGGLNVDAFSVVPQTGSTVEVTGNDPTASPGDSLEIAAGGADVTIDVASAQIMISGAQPITSLDIEDLSLSDIGTLTINGDAAPDDVNIANDPSVAGGDLLTINGGLPIAIRGVASLVFNGLGGDDTLLYDASGGAVTTPLGFNGGLQDGSFGGDFLQILGSFTTQILNYSTPGTEGNSGSVDLDGALITYTGLEPIDAGDSADTILNFNTTLANRATLRDSSALGAIEIVDNGATFEDTLIPNPSNSLTVNLGDQGDTLNVGTLDSAYAASMIIIGGAGVDDVQLSNVTISNTPGRGLDVAGVETLGVTRSTLSNNTADVGAGLRVTGGTTTIDSSTFSGNTATGDAATQGGGGIFNASDMTIRNGSVISGNTASGLGGSGGGILNGAAGTLTILATSISGNVAAAEGGGLWNDQGSMVISGGALIFNNRADGDLDPMGVATDLQGGGGIFNNGGTLTINETGGGVSIQQNVATGSNFGSGGGIMSVGGDVSISGALIDMNEAVRAGGGIEVVDGTVLITSTDITNNDVAMISSSGFFLPANPGNGGGVHVTGTADVTVDGGSVVGNRAEREGGGLWNNAGTMTIEGGALVDSNVALGPAADDGGGGIFNNGGALVISDSATVIRNNLADGVSGSGGGIFSADGGSVSITDATILRNTATIDGGGLFASGDSASVDLTGVLFSENTSGDSGAGAFVDGPTTTISGSRFTNNEALGTGGLDGDGGGLFLRGRTTSGSFNISGSAFSGNTALGGGGGAFFVDADGSISGGGVVQNQVFGNGTTFASGSGGLAIIGQSRIPSVSISGVSVDRNTAPAAAGIGIIDSLVTIDNAEITDNTALESLSGGGGLGVITNTVLAGNALTLNASLIAGNSTTGEGGGLGIINGNVLITDSTIRDNQATGGRGGGIGLLGNGIAGTATLRSTTIHGNTASVNGGGIAVLNMGLDLVNVTISGNDAGAAGGGIAYDNSVDTVARSIGFSTITSNTSTVGGSSVTATGSTIDVTASIFSDGEIAAAPGTLNSLGYNLDSGNTGGFSQPTDLVNTEPQLGFLLDNGGPVFTHALFRGSPAIDAGPLSGPLTDARSVTRPLDGDGNGTPVFDIGAFEGETILEVFVDDVQVDENSGTATVTVQSLASASGPFSVDYATVDGTATQASDYAAATGTLSFAGIPGESQSFTVSIVDDAVVENAETLSISLSNPSNTMIDTTDTATLTIIDNDVAVLTLDDVSVDEGNLAGVPALQVVGGLSILSLSLFGGGRTTDGSVLVLTDDMGNDVIFEFNLTGTLSTVTGSIPVPFDTFSTVDVVSDNLVTAINAAKIGINAQYQGLGQVSLGRIDQSRVDIDGFVDPNDPTMMVPGLTDATLRQGFVDDGEILTIRQGSTSVNFEFEATTGGGGTQPGNVPVAFTVGDTLGQVADTLADAINNNQGGLTIAAFAEQDGNRKPTGRVLLQGPTETELDVSRANTTLNLTDAPSGAIVSVLSDSDFEATMFGSLLVFFDTSDGTAIASDDYIASSGMLRFVGNAGEIQTVFIPIVDDGIVENTETINVGLSDLSGLPIDISDTAIVSIIDNDVLIPTDIDLGTSITDTPDPVLTGQIVEYTVTVTNFGSTPASSVVSTTTIPSEFTVSSASSDLGIIDLHPTNGVVTTTIAAIVPGTTVTMTINAVAGTIPGTVRADTSVTSLVDNDVNPSNDSASEDTTIAPTNGVEGHVFCDANNNGQPDAGEQGAGTLVFLDANDNGRLDSGERSTTTDPAGHYRFENINGTTVNVAVSVPTSCSTIPDEPHVSRSTIQVGDLVRSIDSLDIDGDGDRDLVAVAEFSESLTVIENEAGQFIGGTDIAVGDRPRSLDTFETGLSASRTVTIAVAGIGTSESGGAVYTTDGRSAATRHPSSSGPIDVLVDDFNGDGLHDVLSASFRQPLLELRMGGSSEVLTTETLSAQVLSIDSGNLDSDEASREVVVSGYGFRPFGQTEVQPTRLEVFRTSGPGGVTKFASIVVPAEVVEVEVADVIGNDPSDGIDDFVDEIVVLLHSGKLLVYPMSGGTIGQPIETAVRGGATAFDLSDRVNSSGRLIDFNGDGKIDVAVANTGARPLSQSEPKLPGFIELYTGTGDGRFARATEIKNVSSPADLVIDDFSGDGFAEIAVANFYGEVNVDVGPPEFSLPSAITILQLGLTSREVTVTAGAVTTQDFPFPSADPQFILDTSGDHSVTALDALRVINELGRRSLAEGEQIQSSRAPTDVNGDGRTSAIDALLIINYLRQETVAEGAQVRMADLMDDDEDDRDQIIAAIDLLLTHDLV